MRPPPPDRPAPQARRRDARRQPPLGQGRRRATPRTATGPAPPTSSRCSAGARRSASRWSRCGCSPPTTSTGPAEELEPLLGDHRATPSRRLADAAALAAAPGGRPRPAARRRPPSGSRRPRRPPATSTGCWSTSPSGTAAGARSPTPSARCSRSTPAQGTSLEELAEVLDVEHIAEHLYTKGQPDPDLVIRTSRRAAARRLPALAERAERVLLLRGLLARLPPGRLPARRPRLRRSASAASAPEPASGV